MSSSVHPEYISGYPNVSFAPLTIELYELDSPTTVLNSSTLEVYQAPVVMVHGLNSNGYSFRDMDWSLSFINDSDPNLYALSFSADYESTNRAHFHVNRNVVPVAISQVLDTLRSKKISAGKAVVVGHSMGGILARLYLQNASDFDYRDDIQKLITLRIQVPN